MGEKVMKERDKRRLLMTAPAIAYVLTLLNTAPKGNTRLSMIPDELKRFQSVRKKQLVQESPLTAVFPLCRSCMISSRYFSLSLMAAADMPRELLHDQTTKR